jgi:CubicO group peptidase (beta-lactamase class C family)
MIALLTACMAMGTIEQWMSTLTNEWADTGSCSATAICGECGLIGAVGNSSETFVVQGEACVGTKNGSNMFSSTKSMFEIASNTKIFTALLLQQLSDAGHVSMTAQIGKWLPAGATFACASTPNITLHQLGSHTAGLPKVMTNKPSTDPDNNPYTNLTQAEVWTYLSDLPCCNAAARTSDRASMSTQQCLLPPGAFLYSNFGFGLLGYVLELQMASPYELLLQQYQLRGLGMNSTKITLTPSEWQQRVPPGHEDKTGEITERNLPYGVLKGEGALHSTIDDMLLFLRAASAAPSFPPHGATKGLKRAGLVPSSAPKLGEHSLHRALAQMTAPVASDLDSRGRGAVGMGWQLVRSRLRAVYWKSGGTRGYGSFMAYEPISGRVAVALENCGNCGGKAVHLFALALLDGSPEEALLQRRAYTATELELKPFIGHYIFPVGAESPTNIAEVPVAVTVETVGSSGNASLRLVFNATGAGSPSEYSMVDTAPFLPLHALTYPAARVAFAFSKTPTMEGNTTQNQMTDATTGAAATSAATKHPSSQQMPRHPWEIYFLLSEDGVAGPATKLVVHSRGVDAFAQRV